MRDGALERVRVGEMKELLSTRGVTVEDVNFKTGAAVLTSLSSAARSGKPANSNHPLLVLTNHNHAATMAHTSTSIMFKQFFHHTTGAHAGTVAASIRTTV